MRTRNLSKNQQEPPDEGSQGPEEDVPNTAHGSSHDGGSLASISETMVNKTLKRANARRGLKNEKECSDLLGFNKIRPRDTSHQDGKRDLAEDNVKSQTLEDFSGGDCESITRKKESEGTTHNDDDTFAWENGSIFVNEYREAQSIFLGGHMAIEFTESPSGSQQKQFRRASAEEKESAELVHKVHLLCLLARGRVVDHTCNDSLIQDSLLSLLPPNLLKLSEIPILSPSQLGSLVSWFHSYFHVQNGSSNKGSFKSRLTFAIASREGTSEEVAALSVALFRALNMMTRFVAVLNVAPLKPDMRKSMQLGEGESSLDTHICSLNNFTPTTNHDNNQQEMKNYLVSGVGGSDVQGCPENMDSSATTVEVSKRKGDLEFELQMEMALSATAMASHSCHPRSLPGDVPSSLTSRFPFCSTKRMRTVNTESRAGTVWSRKQGPPFFGAEVYCGGEVPSGRWVHIDAANGIIDDEEKIESSVAAFKCQLRYAVAFAGNGAKDVTRRYCKQWYKVSPQRVSPTWWETVLAPLKKLESMGSEGGILMDEMKITEANKLNLGAGNPSFTRSPEEFKSVTEGSEDKKDILKQVGKVDHLRVVAQRNAIEDMELETKALTEPLPTNQLAYRNHHLYVIEKWLKKYQVLHPKGPILGYCSGNPVYPRSCVKTLQTKQKWYREGLQVRASEVPVKVVKRSKKLQNVEMLEAVDPDGQLTMELFGDWQLEPLNLPTAMNGIVPKNERGRVDVWSEKCLPPGTTHLKFPRLVPVVKRFGIDFAPAMVGFEFRNGCSIPIFEGIVVCTEFEETILEAYAEEERMRVAAERKQSESEALSRWFQLLSSMVTRQRLHNSYSEPLRSATSPGNPAVPHKSRPSAAAAGDPCPNTKPEAATKARGSAFLHPSSSENREHEHVFSPENQIFDEDSGVLTKICHCGFSIQVEEL